MLSNSDKAGDDAVAAFRAVIRVYGLLGRIMQPYFHGLGISGSQWSVLRALVRVEQEGREGLRMVELGDRLLIRPPSISGLVGRLQKSGLVWRYLPKCDLRCKEVRLTPKGRDLVDKILKTHRNQIRYLMCGLNSGERQELLTLLEKLGNHLYSITNGLKRNGASTGTVEDLRG